LSYSLQYIDHFTKPRGVGEVVPPDASSEVKHEGGGCFDNIRLTLRIDNNRIIEAKFRARACSGTIAACSALVEKIEGLNLVEASILTPDDLAEYLGGIPDKKRHSVELVIKALSEALKGLS